MKKLDPRRNAFRADLAAASLKDQVRAPRYVEGEVRQVCAPQAPIRVAPRFDAPLATEALCGETLTIYDMKDGWGWVQLHSDGYVGYTPLDGISVMPEKPTHKVASRLTYVYPAPDMKQPPFMRLGFSAAVTALGAPDGKFVETSRGGFVFADHLVGINERVRDFVRVAERFVGAPYLWGGKTATGIDCSGLVQISLQAAGIPCPRDSDMQFAEVGEPIDSANLDAIQRGDLLFWRGHVALAQSGDWMVHASGFHMEVVVEPIRRAVERIAEMHGPLIGIKRPPSHEQMAASLQAQAGSQPRPARVSAQPQEKAAAPLATEARPAEANSAEPKPVEAKSAKGKEAEARPAENRAGDAKPAEGAAGEASKASKPPKTASVRPDPRAKGQSTPPRPVYSAHTAKPADGAKDEPPAEMPPLPEIEENPADSKKEAATSAAKA